ncbi:hypothetical protein [Methylobacterium radiodurans]|uniref:Uncharacterized protein n=1 Tax=Methylobacterium radiodurans TaxID=2202828 RepID=A0A2U8VTN0_9HYPH|nr:hypothetical protein [Methylobacterium radiodurans]AWN37124.1 hypothetical protein DK427_16450 [Methylobacterium radiodurans]
MNPAISITNVTALRLLTVPTRSCLIADPKFRIEEVVLGQVLLCHLPLLERDRDRAAAYDM